MNSDGDEGIRLGSCLFKLLIDCLHTSFRRDGGRRNQSVG